MEASIGICVSLFMARYGVDPRNKPGEGLDSAAGDGPAVPVDPLSLSSLLSQGFDEGPARQALRKFKNDTQAALDFLIGGGAR